MAIGQCEWCSGVLVVEWGWDIWVGVGGDACPPSVTLTHCGSSGQPEAQRLVLIGLGALPICVALHPGSGAKAAAPSPQTDKIAAASAIPFIMV